MVKYKTGMFVYALAFLLGIVFVQQFSILAEIWQYAALLLAVLSLIFILRNFKRYPEDCQYKAEYTSSISIILLILLGILYASSYAKYRLSCQLGESYTGQNLIISGIVSSLPVNTDKAQRFEFDVTDFRLLDKSASINKKIENFPKKLRLSWYYGTVNVDEQWRL